MKTRIYALIVMGALTAFAENSIAEVPSFKSVCVAEKSTGFNWRNGEWVQQIRFPPENFIVQKLNAVELNQSEKPSSERPIACRATETMILGDYTVSSGCYINKVVGEEKPLILAQICKEYSVKNKIHSIKCENLTFHPDGAFIQTPWHDNIDKAPLNGSRILLF